MKDAIKFVGGLVCLLIVLAFLCLFCGCAADNQIGFQPFGHDNRASVMGNGDQKLAGDDAGRNIVKDSPVNTGTQYFLGNGEGWKTAVLVLVAILLVVGVLAIRAHVARLNERLNMVETERDELRGELRGMQWQRRA